MPEIWERTLATAPSNDWNFSAWRPDAVVINLGTNDWHGCPSDWSSPTAWKFITNFTTTYIEFVEKIAAVYTAETHVFIAVGPM